MSVFNLVRPLLHLTKNSSLCSTIAKSICNYSPNVVGCEILPKLDKLIPAARITNPSVRNISRASAVLGIQEKISSLQLKKRAARKKRPLDEEIQRPPGLYDIVAFATAEEYNLEGLITGLKNEDLYVPRAIDNTDVVHAVAKYQVDKEPRELFFFREGSVVMWNVTDLESSNVLNFLKEYEQDGYSEKLVQNESELMNYRHQEAG